MPLFLMPHQIFSRKYKILWFSAVLLLSFWVFDAKSLKAQNAIESSESKLIFRGLHTDPLQRTFTLNTPDDLARNLSVTSHDLVDSKTGAVILSDNIEIEALPPKKNIQKQGFKVTIDGGKQPGEYVGKLEIRHGDRPADAPLTILLEVIIESVPSVDVDVNSKSIVLATQQPLLMPWFGWFERANAPKAAIYLIQSAQGSAVIQSATVLALHNSQGETLQSDSVKINTSLPLTLKGNEAASIEIEAIREKMRAGEYTGILLVGVRNQPMPIQVPLRLQVKHAPLLPFIVLAGGLLTAFLLNWWNSEGREKGNLVKAIQKLEEDIRTGKKLQVNERNKAMELLEKAFSSVEAGDPLKEIEDEFEMALAFTTESRDKAEKFLIEALSPLQKSVKNISLKSKVKSALVQQLQDMENHVIEGDYFPELDSAKDLLRESKKRVDALEEISSKLAEVRADKREEVARQLNMASTIIDMIQILKKQDIEISIIPGISFSQSSALLKGKAVSNHFRLSFIRKLQLTVPNLLVTFILYFFTLTVGWISLYASSTTFGANPEDYISLLLWGSTVEVVRGKTINLQAIYEKKKKP